MTTTNTEVRIQPDQFKALITALTGDDKKLSVIVGNANDETVARARGDNAVAAELAKANATITARCDALAATTGALMGEMASIRAKLDAPAPEFSGAQGVVLQRATPDANWEKYEVPFIGQLASRVDRIETILRDLIEALNAEDDGEVE